MTRPGDDQILWHFRDVIARRLGMACDDAPADQLAHVLRDRLRATGRTDAGRYLDHLETADPRQPELGRLAERLTVTETYFFRHLEQIRAFTEVALPECARDRTTVQQVHILSAGCSSGEEPYTLAMEAQVCLPAAAGWTVTITGVDISDQQITRARRGVYSEWSLRATPDAIRARHFRTDGRNVRLDDRIRAAVAFETRNLMDAGADFWLEGRFDIIFCRNVLMYFTTPAMHEVVARLTRSLKPGGFLFLGSAETLRGISQDFHLCHTHDTFYYRRRAAGDDGTARLRFTDRAATAPPPSPPPWRLPPDGRPSPDPPPPTTTTTDDPSWIEDIAKASRRIASLADAASSPGEPEEPRPALPPPDAPPDAPTHALQAIRSLLHRERYQDAMQALNVLPAAAANDPDTQLLLAVALTHRGEIAEAERVCRRLLSLDELNAGAHYLMALCADHGGDRANAWEHDRTAAYLDPGFAMPHVHMGRLAKADGRADAAHRAFRHAHALLEREDASRILLFGGGFSRAALLGLCRAEVLTAGGRHDR